MLEAKFEYVWHVYKGHNHNHIDMPGRWSLVYAGGAAASELTTFLAVDLEYRRAGVQECVEFLQVELEGGYEPWTGSQTPGLIAAGPDGALLAGNRHVMFASDFAEDDRVVMTTEEALRVLRDVLAVMDHPDYRNPDAHPFSPLTVEVIATGEASIEEYWRRGGVTPIMPEKYQR